MKDKQYDPARHNEKSPAEGFASVNTHNPEEEPLPETPTQQQKDKDGPERHEAPGKVTEKNSQ